MSYHPPDCKCLGSSCREAYNQPPDSGSRQAPDLIGQFVAASNPFNRIEDRERELRGRMQTR